MGEVIAPACMPELPALLAVPSELSFGSVVWFFSGVHFASASFTALKVISLLNFQFLFVVCVLLHLQSYFFFENQSYFFLFRVYA